MKVDDKLLKKSLDTALDFSVIKKEGFKPKKRNFDETIDLVINLKDLNLNNPKERIDKELILPHEVITEDLPNACVVASDEMLLQAKKTGIDTLTPNELEELSRKEKKDKKKYVKNYRFFIVEGKLMRDIARYLARFLGPRGKMPKPFPSGYGIVTDPEDLADTIERYKRIVRIQVKKHPIVQVRLGKKSMEKEKIYENLKTIVDYVADQMPHRFNNFKSMYLKTTMGKPVKVDEDYLEKVGVKV